MKTIATTAFWLVIFTSYAQNNESNQKSVPQETLVYSSSTNLIIRTEIGTALTLYSASGTYIGRWYSEENDFCTIEFLTEGTYVVEVETKGQKKRKRILVL